MAKKSLIVANCRRQKTVAKYAGRRAALKEQARQATTLQERLTAQRQLAALPRDASPVRLRNRDSIDGRARGYFRVAGVSRIRLRQLAHAGQLPGITKSSW